MAEYFFGDQVIIRLFNSEADLDRLIFLYICTWTSPDLSTQLVQMRWPGHNPAQDRWVAELAYAPNYFIGYVYTFMRPPQESVVQVIVHPAWRRRGLGSALLNRVLNR